jgi:hypothetical protein
MTVEQWEKLGVRKVYVNVCHSVAVRSLACQSQMNTNTDTDSTVYRFSSIVQGENHPLTSVTASSGNTYLDWH